MKTIATFALSTWIFAASSASSQQVPDEDFHFANDIPAFETDHGPTVCIDEAHKNFHTAEGRYLGFANLLRADGFKIRRFNQQFSAESLKVCDIAVVANASALAPEAKWPYPHGSAFTGEEIEAVMHWVRAGGNLLIFADHPPFAGGAADLGAVLGLVMTDVYESNVPNTGSDSFTLEEGTLHDHAIVRGRNDNESVSRVVTFAGQPAQITQYWQPLMTFGDEATAYISPWQTYQQNDKDIEWPQFSIAGWVHASTREWDQGRIVFVGEAAVCSAQLAGKDKLKMGMNNPDAKQNPQFCLNTVRWLARIL